MTFAETADVEASEDIDGGEAIPRSGLRHGVEDAL